LRARADLTVLENTIEVDSDRGLEACAKYVLERAIDFLLDRERLGSRPQRELYAFEL